MKIPTRAAYKLKLKSQRGKQFYYDMENPKSLEATRSEMRVQKRMKSNKIKPIKLY